MSVRVPFRRLSARRDDLTELITFPIDRSPTVFRKHLKLQNDAKPDPRFVEFFQNHVEFVNRTPYAFGALGDS